MDASTPRANAQPQHSPNGHNTIGANAPLLTPEELASRHGFKRVVVKGKPEWHGKNPDGGADENGFWLREDGSGYDRKTSTNYTQPEVAKLFNISLDDYAPCVEWKARNGHTARANGQAATPTPGPVKTPSTDKNTARFDWKKATIYQYHDEEGVLLSEVGRIGEGATKDVRQRRPDGKGGWIHSLGDARRVLYRLDEVEAAENIIVCEGEKAVEVVRAALAEYKVNDWAATCNIGGTGMGWRDEYTESLIGKAVYIVPDADAPGRKHAQNIARSVAAFAEVVGVVELTNQPEKAGADDWLKRGHSVAGLIEVALDTPQWTPGATVEPVPESASKEGKQKRPVSTGLTAAQLLDANFPEPKWIVPGVLPEGSTVLAGHPKLGKSWLALGLGVAVACGGRAFGSIEVEAGDVMYLALEDNPRRLKSRLQKVLQGDRPQGLERLHVFHEWERLDDGGLIRLDTWLSKHPGARLIIIDTFQKVKPRARAGGNSYETDYDAAAPLNQLAAKWGVAIVCVHHLRKSDSVDDVEAVSGSYGITGAADAILGLRRQRGQADAVLSITGRDVEEAEHALKWQADFCTWELLGDAAEFRLTNARAEVVNALRAIGEPVTPKTLWESAGVGKSLTNLKTMLWRMAQDGEATSKKGKYSLPVLGVTSNPSNRVTQATPTLPGVEATPLQASPSVGTAASEPYQAPKEEAGYSGYSVTPVTPVTPVTRFPQLDKEAEGF